MAMRLDEYIAQNPVTDEPPQAIRLGDVKALEPETIDQPGLNALGLPRVTPEQEEAWRNEPDIGYFEALVRQDQGEMMPFTGTIKLLKKNWRLYQAVNRMRQDQEDFEPYAGRGGLKAEDGRIITEWNFRMAEEAARGYSVGGNIARGQANLPRFMIEFALTGGLVSLGGKAIAASGSVAAAQLAERVAANYAVKVGLGAVARTAINPAQGLADAAEKQAIANLDFTEDGLKIAKTAAESPAMSITKGMALLFVENMTELLGPAIGSRIIQPISKLLSGPSAAIARTIFPRKMTTGLIKLHQRLRPNVPITRLFNAAGIHSFTEELGEEYVGGLINAALGLDVIGKDDKSPIDRVIGALTNGEEMLVAAGVLAFPVGGRMAANATMNGAIEFIQRRKAENGKESPIEPVPAGSVEITDEQIDKIQLSAENGETAQFGPSEQEPLSTDGPLIEEASKYDSLEDFIKAKYAERLKRRQESLSTKDFENQNDTKTGTLQSIIEAAKNGFKNMTPEQWSGIMGGLTEQLDFSEQLSFEPAMQKLMSQYILQNNLVEALIEYEGGELTAENIAARTAELNDAINNNGTLDGQAEFDFLADETRFETEHEDQIDAIGKDMVALREIEGEQLYVESLTKAWKQSQANKQGLVISIDEALGDSDRLLIGESNILGFPSKVYIARIKDTDVFGDTYHIYKIVFSSGDKTSIVLPLGQASPGSGLIRTLTLEQAEKSLIGWDKVNQEQGEDSVLPKTPKLSFSNDGTQSQGEPTEGKIADEVTKLVINDDNGSFSFQATDNTGQELSPQRYFELLKREVTRTGRDFREFMSKFGLAGKGKEVPLENINADGKIEVNYHSSPNGTHLVEVPTTDGGVELIEYNPALHDIVSSTTGVAVPEEARAPLARGYQRMAEHFRARLAERLSRLEKNIVEKLSEIQDNAEKAILAQEALGYLNEVRDFVKRSIKVAKDSPIAEELRDLPLYYRSRTGQAIDEVLQELKTQFPGLDIKSDTELVDFLVNLENQRAQVAEYVRELRQETEAHKTGTILKQRLKDIRNGIKEGRYRQRQEAQTVGRMLEALLKRSNMPKESYKKFIKVLRRIDTIDDLIKILPEIERRVNVEIDRAKRNKLKNQIAKELDNIKPKVKKGLARGKFTSFVQDALDTLLAAHKLKAREAQRALDENINVIIDSNSPAQVKDGQLSTVDPELYSGLKILQNRMLQYKADPSSLSIADIQELLQTIQHLKEGGKAAKAVREIKMLMAKQERISKTAETLTQNPEAAKQQLKTFPRALENLGANMWYYSTSWVMGWNNLLARMNMGVKGIKMGEGYLSKEFNVFRELVNQGINTMNRIKQIQDLYRTAYAEKGRPLSEWEFNTRRAQDTKRVMLGKYKFIDKAGNMVTKFLEVSKGEAIQMWMHLQNPEVKAQYSDIMGINEESGAIGLLEGFLTPQDKVYAKSLLDLYASSYKAFNALVSKLTGVNLKRYENYSPIYRRIAHKVGDAMTSIFEQVLSGQKLSSAPKASKVRSASTQLEFAPMNATDAAMQYFAEVEHYLATAEKMREVAEVFNNRGIQDLIKGGWGKSTLKHVAQFVDKMITNGKTSGTQIAAVNFIMNNYVISSIAAKPAVMVKQFMSFPAFADQLPMLEFAKGLADFAKDPKGKYKFLSENSDMMKARGYKWTPGLDEAMNSIEFQKFLINPTFVNWSLAIPRFGDRMGIVIGGWPTYRYHKEVLGKSHAEAMNAFEEAANSSQQSSLLSEMSSAQTGDSFMRAFTRFLSAPNQYFRKEVMAVEAFRAGQIDLKQFFKTMMIYHVILPVMFQAAADMFFDLDDDKQRKLRAALVGSFNGYFVLGQIATSVVTRTLNALSDDDAKKLDQFDQAGLVPQALNQLDQMGGDIFKLFEEPSWAQVFEVIKEVAETGQYLTPLPTPEAINIIEGAQQMLQAENQMDYIKGFGQVAGWSDYVLNDALADKKGSKKRDFFNESVIRDFGLDKKDKKTFNRSLKNSNDFKKLLKKL